MKIKKIQKKISFYFVQAIVLIIAIFIIKINFLDNIDIWIYWKYMEIRSNIANNIPSIQNNKEKITIIWIDEKFFSNQNISIQWLHRWYYAKALENIKKHKAKSIWIDVLFEKAYDFSLEDNSSKTLTKIFNNYDKKLAKSLEKDMTLAGMYNFNNNDFIKPDDIFLKNNPWVWHINSIVNKSWINIWIKDIIKDKKEWKIEPLSFKVFKKYKKEILKDIYKWVDIDSKIEETKRKINISIANTSIKIPKSKTNDWEDFVFTPIYNNNYKIFNYLSLDDVLKNKNIQEKIENKIILIWAIDPALHDIKATLLWRTPGVAVHANSILSLLNNDFLYKFNKKEITSLIFAILILNILILILFKNNASQKVIFILLIWEIIAITIIWIILSFIWLMSENISIFLPIWTIWSIILLQLIATNIYYLIETTQLKDNFKKLFSLYVWDKLNSKSEDEEEIWKKHANEKEIAIFFSDIAWFTNISEKLTARENIDFLNIYLDKMSEDISINKGFIDKYIWDAIMAFWEDTNSSYLAAKSAILNMISMKYINQEIKNKLNIKADELIDARIWLHYWEAIVWDIWSERYKLNYTAIWDNVNLAARLEWINKFYWTKICASEDIVKDISNKNELLIRKLDKIQVKWKENAISIYEIIPNFKNNLSKIELETTERFIKIYEKWLEKYFNWHFEEAINILIEINKFKYDKASKIIIERSEKLKNTNNLNWNWIWKFDEK